MHNYRKNPRISNNRTVDGFLGGVPGQRKQGDVWSQQKGRADFRPRSSSVDDFKRPEGFHSNRSQRTIGVSAKTGKKDTEDKKAAGHGQGSILHMTLPGGSLARKQNLKAKKHRKWYDVRRWGWRRTSVAAACLVLLVGGFLAFKGFLSLNKVFKGGGNAAALQETVTPDLLRGEGDGRVNVLLLGRGGEGHDGADLTDTILLASIDPVNKTAGMVSIPRDFWVRTSSGQSSKINAVFANAKNKALRGDDNEAKAEAAGVEALKEAVSDVLGVSVHYYSIVDFTGFKKAVDIVGGVDINVPEKSAVSEHLWDSTAGRPYYLDVPAGQQHFDSTKALYFARSRKTSPRGDFDRAERQRLFISALSQKVLSAGTYTNPVKITQLMDAFGNHVATDFSVSDAARFSQIAKEIPVEKIKSIGLAEPPDALVHTDMISGQSVVVPRVGIGDYSEIHALIRAKLPDGYIVKENAKIDVLNGTATAGLAKSKADELKTYGYNIAKVGDAPTKNYNKTIFVDLTGNKKPYTENYLEKRFDVKAVSKLPDNTIMQAEDADFVIILGSDER